MKNQSNSIRRFLSLASAACLALSALTASAQVDQTYTGGNGGTWDAGTTPDWSGSVWTNGNYAHFNTGGTVNVPGAVTSNVIFDQSSTDLTLTGAGPITVATGNEVLENDGNANFTIDTPLQIDDPGSTGDRYDINNNGSGTITINGDISYINTTANAGGQALIFNGGSDASFVLNGSFSGSAVVPARIIMYGSGSLYLNGNYNNANPGNTAELDAGTTYLGTSQLGTGQISLGGPGSENSAGATLLTNGAQHITNTVNGANYAFGNPFSSGYVTVGGNTADVSTYDHINTVVTGLHVTAVAGGRVNIGSITGNGDVHGLIKQGAGTVVLNGNTSEGVYNGFNGLTPPYIADVQQGTLLFNSIADGSKSAFGTEGGNIQVEAGATLGGVGSTLGNQPVVAVSASSIIAPGDAGQANLGINPTIGTMHLDGGLSITTGATLAFKINGSTNDYIDLGPSDFTPTGTITLDFSNVGAGITQNHFYTLFGTDALYDDSGATYDYVAPYGYFVSGVSDDLFHGDFSVEFQAAPEPSTYALMLGGLGFLAFCLRRKNRASV